MSRKPICTLDLETDPFKFRRAPRPFAAGLYDGARSVLYWGGNCIERMMKYLEKMPPSIIYAHNGGKFDWFFFLEYLRDRSQLQIINGRIVRAYLGHHEIRDSFSILPFALKQYQKEEIDYGLMEPELREKHRAEILHYLELDCKYLHELVTAFWEEFGDILTVGSAAMRELKKFHSFSAATPRWSEDRSAWACEYDAEIRSRFYYGGRVQVFGGVREVAGPLQVYDVNSMYPYVMAAYAHPVSVGHKISNRIEPDTCFVKCRGESFGAFPVRTKEGIRFPHGRDTFDVTIHEFNAAMDTGTFRCEKILETLCFLRLDSFADFVNHFYNARLEAEVRGDKIHKLFYKFVLNSCYGKFAQNPENYYEYEITGLDAKPEPWELEATCFDGPRSYMLWKRPISRPVFHNIATAASITGASRATLLRGICAVHRPCYCDTDSIIAAQSGSLELSETKLGGWKVEAEAASAVFAGKKIYALFDTAGNCIKKAHKGFNASGEQIRAIARGGEFVYECPSPCFKIGGDVDFVERRIKATI